MFIYDSPHVWVLRTNLRARVTTMSSRVIMTYFSLAILLMLVVCSIRNYQKNYYHFESRFLIKFGRFVSKIWYFFLKELCYLKIFLHYKKYKKYCTQINLFVKRNYLFLISILEIVLIKMLFMILSPRYLFPLSIYVLN